MAITTASVARAPIPVARAAAPGAQGREPRLDLFRGLAMLIILIAHVPHNPWSLWIPARFGPSDAAEMFVFCSGYAAAIAFGGTFARAGMLLGTARILLRCWQIYWAHLALFFTVAMLSAWGGRAFFTGKDYVQELNLGYFFDDTGSALVGLFALTYVPNYFDILPMYLVILLMTPLFVALQRVDTRLALVASLALWLAAQFDLLALPAEPFSDRPWFFNPFGWQLLFFTAFAFARGWIRPPPYRPWLLTLAAAYVLLWVPLSHPYVYPKVGILWDLNTALLYPTAYKTNENILRYLHILALAYLTLWFLRGRDDFLRSAAVRPILRVGQQALPTFLTSMALAWLLGMALDAVGRTPATHAAANLAGLGTVIAVAYVVGWYKRAPWHRHRNGAVRA